MNCSSVENTDNISTSRTSSSSKDEKKPNPADLVKIMDFLNERAPRFFLDRVPHEHFHPQMVFENNYDPYNPRVIKSSLFHRHELNKYKVLSRLKYVTLTFEVQSITVHPEEHMVKMRWRVVGMPNLRFLKFWRYSYRSFAKFRKSASDESDWIDGVSSFYLNEDGQIIKHKLDRTIQDGKKLDKKPGLLQRLTGTLGLSSTAS